MRKKLNDLRKRAVTAWMNDSEIDQFKRLQGKSTEKYKSSYLRKLALQKPVRVNYRNETAEHFLEEMLPLKKELNTISGNFNKAVKQLNALEKIPEFRLWIRQYNQMHHTLLDKVETIKLKTSLLYDQWLQE